MSSIIPVLSSPISLLLKLGKEAKKYQTKKKTKDRVLSALGDEIEAYMDTFDQISAISKDQVLPILKSIKGMPTVHQMNDLLEGLSQMPLMWAQLVRSFIKLAKACSEVSANRGFMESLKETSLFLYDFVDRMKDTYVAENTIRIDGRYYRFFKVYQDQIFKEIHEEDLEKAVDEVKGYVKKIKHYVDKTSFIKRQTRKKYIKNFKELCKVVVNVKIEQTSIVDLRAYMPSRLLPVMILFDEIVILH